MIDQKRNSNTHPFVLAQKDLEISVALGLRKVTIVEKLSNLVHFDYFSSKALFFSMMCPDIQKDTSKMKSLEFCKATVPYFKSNLKVIYSPKKEGVNLHKLYPRTKKFFGGQHILNHNEIFFSAI